MRILLSNSYVKPGHKMITSGRCQINTGPGLGIWPPSDLAQAASIIREYADDISIVDFMISDFSEKEALEKIIGFNPSVIILQSSTPALKNDLLFCHSLKRAMPETVIVFFGLHASVRPDDILSEEIEFAVRSEPEKTLSELIRSLKDNAKGFEDIKGLSYWKNGRTFHNPDREYVEDLDSFPFPARDLLQNDKYIMPYNQEPFAIINVSRGCPYRCIFCTSGFYYGRSWRCRSPENIVSEIEDVLAKYKINNFLFLSDTFNFDREFVFKLCRLIIDKRFGIKWVCNSRVDKLDEELALQMRKAGCWLVSLGIESASGLILEKIKKNITVYQSQKAVDVAKRAGIKTLCYFVFGLPGENADTMKETIKFIKNTAMDFVYIYSATPFPGTEFYNQARDNKWLVSKNWNRYLHGLSDVISYPSLTNIQIREAVTKAYYSFYLRPRVFWETLISIRSPKQFIVFIKIGFGILKLSVRRIS